MSNATNISPHDIVSGLDWRRLTAQRWFRQKSSDSGHVDFVDGWPVFRKDVLHGWWLLIRVTSDTESIDYQLSVVLTTYPQPQDEILGTCKHGNDTLSIIDGIGDPVILASLLKGGVSQFARGTVETGTRTDTLLSFDELTNLPAESTNSLVKIGSSHLLKVYRAIDAGGTRETELLAALATAKVTSVPSLEASVEYRVDNNRFALAIVQEWIEGAEDAWSWLTRSLADGPCDIADDVVAMADAVCEVHRGLRGTGSRSWSASDSDDLKRRIFDGIARVERSLVDATHYRDVLQQARELVTTTVPPISGRLHAVHGDLHLGQLLRQSRNRSTRYRVIDFEGEPLASLDERMAWHSPMKDVAGMLRSFDYAVGFARKVGAPGDADEWNVWLRECEMTFLDRYWAHESDSGVDRVEAESLLALTVIEKALYEIAYEAVTRPDWIDIPLGGLSRALSRLCVNRHE